MTGDGGMCPVTGADFTGESVHVHLCHEQKRWRFFWVDALL